MVIGTFLVMCFQQRDQSGYFGFQHSPTTLLRSRERDSVPIENVTGWSRRAQDRVNLAPPPDDFIFIDVDLRVVRPFSALFGTEVVAPSGGARNARFQLGECG
jgi:hypothetical protein